MTDAVKYVQNPTLTAKHNISTALMTSTIGFCMRKNWLQIIYRKNPGLKAHLRNEFGDEFVTRGELKGDQRLAYAIIGLSWQGSTLARLQNLFGPDGIP